MHFMDNEDLFSKNRTIVVKTVIESKYFLLEPTYGRIIYVSSKVFDSLVKNPTFRRVLNSVAEHFYMSEDENDLISMNSSTLGSYSAMKMGISFTQLLLSVLVVMFLW